MAKSVNIQLTKPFTWTGKNYGPGLNEIPEAAANYAVKRNFGTLSVEAAKTAGNEQSEGSGQKTDTGEGGGNNENGLPENFPMRHVFDKLGFKSVEEIQAKSREDLIGLEGIAEKSADKVLAYGK